MSRLDHVLRVGRSFGHNGDRPPAFFEGEQFWAWMPTGPKDRVWQQQIGTVEKLVKRKTKYGDYRYKVKWRNLSSPSFFGEWEMGRLLGEDAEKELLWKAPDLVEKMKGYPDMWDGGPDVSPYPANQYPGEAGMVLG